jgi:hypothetical protein
VKIWKHTSQGDRTLTTFGAVLVTVIMWSIVITIAALRSCT